MAINGRLSAIVSWSNCDVLSDVGIVAKNSDEAQASSGNSKIYYFVDDICTTARVFARLSESFSDDVVYGQPVCVLKALTTTSHSKRKVMSFLACALS